MYTFLLAVSQSNSVVSHKPDRLHGSYHWDIERAASIALVPLISSQLAFGASPVLDTLLGVIVPLHVHIGEFQSNRNSIFFLVTHIFFLYL